MTTSERDQSRKCALRELRIAMDWTLADVAGLTGLSTAHISLVERELRKPTPQTKVHIARSLGVSVAEIFPHDRPETETETEPVDGDDVVVA